jgi:hypothetical protein
VIVNKKAGALAVEDFNYKMWVGFKSELWLNLNLLLALINKSFDTEKWKGDDPSPTPAESSCGRGELRFANLVTDDMIIEPSQCNVAKVVAQSWQIAGGALFTTEFEPHIQNSI